MRSINSMLVASNLPPVNRLEECVIHVASRNEAEHEQTQHNHNLLLHSGQTQHTLVTSAGGGAASVARCARLSGPCGTGGDSGTVGDSGPGGYSGCSGHCRAARRRRSYLWAFGDRRTTVACSFKMADHEAHDDDDQYEQAH